MESCALAGCAATAHIARPVKISGRKGVFLANL
jgi:hypothetical protein